MPVTRVRAYERRNPHGGTEHVRAHTRRIQGTEDYEDDVVNFEDEEQRENAAEDSDDKKE
ncbi:MAG: hypothetical protein QW292_06520 [Candidatus Parvarchaeota archaeon]